MKHSVINYLTYFLGIIKENAEGEQVIQNA